MWGGPYVYGCNVKDAHGEITARAVGWGMGAQKPTISSPIQIQPNQPPLP